MHDIKCSIESPQNGSPYYPPQGIMCPSTVCNYIIAAPLFMNEWMNETALEVAFLTGWRQTMNGNWMTSGGRHSLLRWVPNIADTAIIELGKWKKNIKGHPAIPVSTMAHLIYCLGATRYPDKGSLCPQWQIKEASCTFVTTKKLCAHLQTLI